VAFCDDSLTDVESGAQNYQKRNSHITLKKCQPSCS